MAINRRDKTKTDRASKVHKDWYKLDLSAIVYPTLQRRDFSSVYRLSVLLKEEINHTFRLSSFSDEDIVVNTLPQLTFYDLRRSVFLASATRRVPYYIRKCQEGKGKRVYLHGVRELGEECDEVLDARKQTDADQRLP